MYEIVLEAIAAVHTKYLECMKRVGYVCNLQASVSVNMHAPGQVQFAQLGRPMRSITDKVQPMWP